MKPVLILLVAALMLTTTWGASTNDVLQRIPRKCPDIVQADMVTKCLTDLQCSPNEKCCQVSGAGWCTHAFKITDMDVINKFMSMASQEPGHKTKVKIF